MLMLQLLLLLLFCVQNEQTTAFSFQQAHSLQRSKTWTSTFSSSFVIFNSNNNRDDGDGDDGDATTGVRLNKAFQTTHSRRQADRLIQEGRVRVNGETPSTMGVRLFPGDIVTLDNERVYWEHRPMATARVVAQVGDGGGGGSSSTDSTRVVNSKNHGLTRRRVDDENEQQQQQPLQHVYIKYWKPRGVECTTDRRVRNNIIDALGTIPGVEQRLWPMGRLDKDSTGLILLTSDGTTTQRVLKSTFINSDNNKNSNDESDGGGGGGSRHWKTYWVETDKRATDQDLQTLSQGVRILAPTSRDGNNKIQWVTTRTDATITRRRPSLKAQENDENNSRLRNQLVFTICEGKNRQIRRMCETLGLTVVRLHRVEFAGINLGRCPRPGSWAFLTKEELDRLLQEDDDNY
jgi:23S rRNA pseudouridine2604 synthase